MLLQHPWRVRIFLLNITKLKSHIRYDDVAALLASIDPVQVRKILEHLEENATRIHDPTGWIAATARRAYLVHLEDAFDDLELPTKIGGGGGGRRSP